MARHAKRDVMTQLKMPKYEVVQMEETGEIKAALKSESLLGIDVDALQTTNDYQVLGHIATVRKEMGVAIAPQAADYVQLCLEGGEDKIVVFGHHIEVLDVLQAKLHRYGVLRIDGSTSPKRRQEYVDIFIRDPHMKVMLGNLQSMGTGVDGLQEVATHCVLVEPSWTPGENQQAVDRLDRGGQQGHVQADFIVAPGSIAEKILVSALGKARVIEKVIG
jgi:SWI/SNF-related matrix-associated actin-dependent regulator 1 of chromatin subfamily A